MRQSTRLLTLSLLLASLVAFTACGDDDGDDGPSLDDFLPPLPTPDGTPQSVFAGRVDSAAQLLPGQARSGLVGDYFIRNSRASFIVQSEARVIGVVPWGGNLVDAVPLDAQGAPAADDHLGEISMVYLLGRTCAHERVDVLLDGAGGGPAVIRARGVARSNDFVNLKGIGVLNVPSDQDPDVPDGVECATTYTLRPDSDKLEIQWTLWNGGDYLVFGPFGTLSDTGGDVESFSPGLIGFDRAGIDTLLTASDPRPAPYTVFQGPGVAYGIMPVHEDSATPNASILVAGVHIFLFGADNFLDITNQDTFYLRLEPKAGLTHRADLVVGRDANDVDVAYHELLGEATTEVSGQVSFGPSGSPAAGARVGVFADADGDAIIDADEQVVSYFDADAEGQWSGRLPPGSYLLRGDLKDVSRSAAVMLEVGASATTAPAVTMPEPARYDFTITDSDTGAPIPVKLTVIGRHPTSPDKRVQEVYDRSGGVVQTRHALHGTTVPAAMGDPTDAPLLLPAGASYRVFASRGPEWSIASIELTPTAGETGTIDLELTRVVDTGGYIAAEFHQHAIGSPDSPVPFEFRLASLVVEGVEFFASTDHDYLSDYDPLIDAFGLRGLVDAVVGVEATPFAYGHFIAFPLDTDAADPSNGAVDWAAGMQGFAMLPRELWTELRARGAKVLQVNHPRATATFGEFQSYFDVAGLSFDFTARTITGNSTIPADWLRLPDATAVFSDAFDTIEVCNGFRMDDTNGDGEREVASLDINLRDWMNFLSFGKLATPMGNSDTHTREKDPAGMPRTMIRVGDDSAAGLMAGLDDDIYATLLGSGGTPRDVVVTNGPMLSVEIGGQPAIGRTIDAGAGTVTFTVTATAAEWVDIDTIEVFSNQIFDDPDASSTVLAPLLCFTSRNAGSLHPMDPCANASGGAQSLNVQSVSVSGPARRLEATVTFTLALADIPRPTGSTGDDAWVVVRVRGHRALFPVLLGNGDITESNIDTLVTGNDAQRAAALDGRGAYAVAFTAPILLDFDGGGWTAPFAP